MDLVKKVLKPGVKIKLSPADSQETAGNPDEVQSYFSKISDVKEDGTLEIFMPIEQGKLQLLSPGKRLDMYCYTGNGVYEARILVKERYKQEEMHFITLELTNSLIKNQRREYYRYQCTVPIQDRLMDEEEQKWMLEDEMLVVDDVLPMHDSMMIDISGGGLQFIGTGRYESGDLVYCRFQFGKDYRLCANILECCGNIPGHPGKYRSRARFQGVERREREEIIRHIFLLERSRRKLEHE